MHISELMTASESLIIVSGDPGSGSSSILKEVEDLPWATARMTNPTPSAIRMFDWSGVECLIVDEMDASGPGGPERLSGLEISAKNAGKKAALCLSSRERQGSRFRNPFISVIAKGRGSSAVITRDGV